MESFLRLPQWARCKVLTLFCFVLSSLRIHIWPWLPSPHYVSRSLPHTWRFPKEFPPCIPLKMCSTEICQCRIPAIQILLFLMCIANKRVHRCARKTMFSPHFSLFSVVSYLLDLASAYLQYLPGAGILLISLPCLLLPLAARRVP